MKNEDEGLEGDLIIFWVTLTSLIHNLQICQKRDRELKGTKMKEKEMVKWGS